MRTVHSPSPDATLRFEGSESQPQVSLQSAWFCSAGVPPAIVVVATRHNNAGGTPALQNSRLQFALGRNTNGSRRRNEEFSLTPRIIAGPFLISRRAVPASLRRNRAAPRDARHRADTHKRNWARHVRCKDRRSWLFSAPRLFFARGARDPRPG